MKKNFGIIGNPIKHSLSPVLHNYWFKKYNINADYSIIETTDNDLPDIVEKIKQENYLGVNVTIPFKQKIINHIDKIVNDAELTGSVNTILLDGDNTVIGENTDVFGLQAAYLKEIDQSHNKKALVIGVGPLNGLGGQLCKKIAQNNFEVFVAGRTINSLNKADGLVVGSKICSEISKSLKNRQNAVTNVTNVVKRLKNKII